MIIHLSKDLAQVIHDAVHAGFYAREDDVIRDALTRLMQALPKSATMASKPIKHAGRRAPATANNEETAYDLARRAGVIGCLKGTSRSPTDLSINPKHREGLGFQGFDS